MTPFLSSVQAKKVARRNARAAKAKKVAPRPVNALRPVVRCQTIKYNTKVRAGRGFTIDEIKVCGARGHVGALCARLLLLQTRVQQLCAATLILGMTSNICAGRTKVGTAVRGVGGSSSSRGG